MKILLLGISRLSVDQLNKTKGSNEAKFEASQGASNRSSAAHFELHRANPGIKYIGDNRS